MSANDILSAYEKQSGSDLIGEDFEQFTSSLIGAADSDCEENFETNDQNN